MLEAFFNLSESLLNSKDPFYSCNLIRFYLSNRISAVKCKVDSWRKALPTGRRTHYGVATLAHSSRMCNRLDFKIAGDVRSLGLSDRLRALIKLDIHQPTILLINHQSTYPSYDKRVPHKNEAHNHHSNTPLPPIRHVSRRIHHDPPPRIQQLACHIHRI